MLTTDINEVMFAVAEFFTHPTTYIHVYNINYKVKCNIFSFHFIALKFKFLVKTKFM